MKRFVPSHCNPSFDPSESWASALEPIARQFRDLTWSCPADRTYVVARRTCAKSEPLIIMSSTSPSKEPEVEPEVQSGEEQEQMEKDQQDLAHGHGEFEVKEQDRWLPIANG